MDWIADHLQLVVVFASAIAWWLTQRARAKSDGQHSEEPGAEPGGFEDPDLAERTRRIREEIQRKIEERQMTMRRPAPRVEPPVLPAAQPVPARKPPAPALERMSAVRREAEILEEQEALAEKLRQVEEFKGAALRRAAFEARVGARRGGSVAPRDAIDQLRGGPALRGAIVVREILGPPVGLRH